MKVFLGGTVNKSSWRDKMTPKLEIDYFNPVVEEWDDKAYKQELYERKNCDYCLYIITPRLTGFYALAEIIDDSYKRPDRTVYCYILKDDEFSFTRRQIKSLEEIGKKVEENGGIWFKAIEDVVTFLNSSKNLQKVVYDPTKFDDVFISYGRRHSKQFATDLCCRLQKKNYQVWFDQNNIPLGVDFQEQINKGITKADNFIFIISPHSVRSEYCLKEISLAVKLKKRIIPLLHVEPKNDWDKMHPTIEKLNWIYFQDGINNFDISFNGLVKLIEQHKDYVKKHTLYLNKALEWQSKEKPIALLLAGIKRKAAEAWLRLEFDETQSPCSPTHLHCEYICDSKENSDNNQSDIFLSYCENENPKKIHLALIRKSITTWTKETDVNPGDNYDQVAKIGIEKCSNFLCFITEKYLESKTCTSELKYAIRLNKRIIPVLIEDVENISLPKAIRSLYMLELKQKDEKQFGKVFGNLYSVIRNNFDYHNKHRNFLVKALKWERSKYLQTDLLFGFELKLAQQWIQQNKTTKEYGPLSIHKKYIKESDLSKPTVFISYGRKHSKEFATKLHFKLIGEGFDVWFDQNDIPLGVDFQEQIDSGITKSDNFIFIISPHSIKSQYCLKEIVLAVKYSKRIIPLLHIEPTDYWDMMHPKIEKLNWIYFQEGINDFEASFSGLVKLMESHGDYVNKHTIFLNKALEWNENKRDEAYLLTDKPRQEAENWINTTFKDSQTPCQLTDLHCEYVTESKKTAHNMMTDVFFSYAREDAEILKRLRMSLTRHGITSWVDLTDIKKGIKFGDAINQGIEQANNFIFLITPESVVSKYCLMELEYVRKFNKRIIPLLISPVDDKLIPQDIFTLQYIDFSNVLMPPKETDKRLRKGKVSVKEMIEKDVDDRKEKTTYEVKIEELVDIVNKDSEYHHQHKQLIVHSIKWEKQDKNQSILLRGYDLESAETWLKTGNRRNEQNPVPLEIEFISESRMHGAGLSTEIFISYSTANADFARRLNSQFQTHGKTTWFDQENIPHGVYFETEIKKGIENSDNFVFIISPESIKSPYCDTEVAYAKSLNKRFITLLYDDIPKNEMNETLAKIQWINFKPDEKDFQDSFNNLLRVLDTDREHVQKHTQFLQISKEWQKKGKRTDHLLRGDMLIIAETWLNEAAEKKKKPAPTPLQKELVEASHKEILSQKKKKRQMKVLVRVLLFFSIVTMVIALLFMLNANINAKKAQIAEKEAINKGNEIANLNNEYEKLSEQLMSSLSETEKLKYQQKLLKIKNKKVIEIKTDSLIEENNIQDNDKTNNNSNEIVTENGIVSMFSEGDKKGCIDSAGNILIPAIYDELQVINIAKVKKDKKWGVFDFNGNEIIPVRYDALSEFTGGIAKFKYKGKWGLIDLKGNIILSNSYGNTNLKTVKNKNIENNDNTIYDFAPQMPEYPGGNVELLKQIATNLNYPTKIKNKNIAGTVYVNFVINKKGQIVDVTIKKGINSILNQEAIKVVKNLPKWSPAIKDGQAVNVRQTVPIEFK